MTINPTDRRRNRELAGAISTALNAGGIECDLPDGYDQSLYATVTYEDWVGTLRISDHPQPEGGGWSETLGARHGEADISVIAQSGTGGNLAWTPGGDIAEVGWVRVGYSEDVPDAVKTALDPIIARFSDLYDRRTKAAKQAVATRVDKRRKDDAARVAQRLEIVRGLLAGTPDITVNENPDKPPFSPFYADVPPGSPNRKQRIRAAEEAISQAYATLAKTV